MNSAEDVWAVVLELLKKDLTTVTINTFFDEVKAVSITGTQLTLMVPTEFKKNLIESRFKGYIVKALSELFSGEFDVQFIAAENFTPEAETSSVEQDLDELYTFKNFIVGSSNRFAHAAAVAVAEEQTRNYNPLFIYGDSGLGKTHLLYAIRHEVKRRHPDYKIILVRGNDFLSELITAINTGRNLEFHEKYRSADLFLVDDIQVIAGKHSTEEEVFNTFNTLYEAQKQIVFTSDRPPAEMKTLAVRLRTRFEMGLIADIQPPDFETRSAIVQNKSLQLGLPLSDAVVYYIAEHMTANVRQLEGAVKKLKAHRDMEKTEITPAIAARVIKDMTISTEYEPTPDDIIEETAKCYGFTSEELKGKKRDTGVVLARQVAMYLVRQILNLSAPEIGSIFNKDHTTVLHSINKIASEIPKSQELSITIKDITTNINSRGN